MTMTMTMMMMTMMTKKILQGDPLRTATTDAPLQEEVHNLVERAAAEDPGGVGGVEGGAEEQEAEEDAGADPRLRQLHEQGAEGERSWVQAELSDEDRGHKVELQQEHDLAPLHGGHLRAEGGNSNDGDSEGSGDF